MGKMPVIFMVGICLGFPVLVQSARLNCIHHGDVNLDGAVTAAPRILDLF